MILEGAKMAFQTELGKLMCEHLLLMELEMAIRSIDWNSVTRSVSRKYQESIIQSESV